MVRDGHIRLLPIHVANKIAAGEVVERPASVVKELVENAIDAGSSRIDVTVTAGGRKLIEIRDNGCGMGRDDALLSLERQATSKIRDVDDIERIDTLGFRGEALPSIASVSRFTLKTRRAADESGTELTVTGGSLHDVRELGLPPGTTLDVRDLFFNVPARRKFLRAFQTEQAHIKSVFTLHALAHPEIGFSLTADGRELMRLPPGATLEERVRDLFGAEFCAGLRPVDKTVGDVRVSGFVGLPNQTRNDRSEQYVFINRRPATAPVIAYALREAYPPLDGDRKPIVLLFIEMPSDRVDVNVHPTKREVRFHKPAEVREALILAVTAALGVTRRGGAEPRTGPGPGTQDAPPPEAPGAAVSLRTLAPEAAARPASAPFPYPAPLPPGRPAPPAEAPPPPTGQGLPLFTAPQDGSPWRWCRVLGQLGGRYVLLETDGGLVTLDPRAARERVLYEKLMDNAAAAETLSQKLLLPETVQLASADAARLRKHLTVVQAMGFGVEDFGSDHFIVEALPAALGEVSCRELLGNIAHDLENAGTRRGSEKWREELVAKAACRAVAGGDGALPEAAAQRLVNELAVTRMPYTCPRGRPTMIFTSYRELERKFGR
ncbi:MAG: DNA mismatch repair endonuclease MutL [Verrucomicrobiota bacterium]|jgi:DNA mismatch repair protein MutL|nr:DNA mismatch repair endonuclease MutL [Verrucomicrobiota bacterium]